MGQHKSQHFKSIFMYDEDDPLAEIPRHCLWLVENCGNQEGKIFLLRLKTDTVESGALQVTWLIVPLIVNWGRKWAV